RDHIAVCAPDPMPLSHRRPRVERSAIMHSTPIWSWTASFMEVTLSRWRIVKQFLFGLVVLGVLFATMSHAWSQLMYWVDYEAGDIRRANLDGSGQQILIKGLNGPLGPALDLAGGKMYWANINGGEIRRANLDGTGQETLVLGQNAPGHLALDLAG